MEVKGRVCVVYVREKERERESVSVGPPPIWSKPLL